MPPTVGCINEEGLNVDMYIPRKCHASNTLISAFDYGSIQLNIGEIDANGVYTGTTKTFCLAGYLRHEGQSDHAANRLCISAGIIRGITGRRKKVQQKKATGKAAKPTKGAPKAGAPKKPTAALKAKPGARKPAAPATKAAAKKPAATATPKAVAKPKDAAKPKAAAPTKPAAPADSQAKPARAAAGHKPKGPSK